MSEFDQDGDLIIDVVEVEQGTDPHDAVSRPGATPFRWPEQVLGSEEGWLRGELHAHSSYGVGTESVSKVIARAEKLNLDFLSILDRNTLAPALDESYRSNRLIMIPGMEWGTKESGVALVYTPGSMPSLPRSEEEMSVFTRLVQAQGGLVFAAHPCYPTSPWNWSAENLNGVQAWCMNWRAMPPMGIGLVHEHNRLRKDGRYVSSLARVSVLPGLSANGQASAYWDFEMRNGRQLTLIGGSQSGSPKVPMAEPVTYVYAKEKSLSGIMEGLRLGRTYVSKGLKGPKIEWVGDIFDDDSIDVSMGGTVPLDYPTRYWVRVQGAKDCKLEVVSNGITSRSVSILMDDWVFSYVLNPGHLAVSKIRIVDDPEEMGFGLREVLAMTSPIFANGIVQTGDVEGENGWVKIDNDYMAPSRIDDFINYLEDNFKPSN
ncbi:MAG: CehA/McbA family metallohydrolase [Candidatus Hydrogenedentota bacterium]